MSTNSKFITQSYRTRLEIIEDQARYLQLELWNRRVELWPRDVPRDPVDVLQPGVALLYKGFSIQTQDDLGEVWENGKRSEAAGTIDLESKIVCISSRFPKSTQHFTTAHELGHAVLHPYERGVLRDRPLGPP